MTEWVVVGIYCDGTAAAGHDPTPVANYRRLAGDDGRVWAPMYSANGHEGPVDNQRVWLDADSNVTAPFTGRQAHDTFTCRVCGFNLPRRWEDIERVLDAAYDAPRPRIMLREWAGWLRR